MRRILLLGALIAPAAHSEVTWEEQAERLQNVSAALLDGIPFGEPILKPRGVDFHMAVSLLPKVDPTVGGKSEKVPSSPAHAVPTFQYSHLPAGFLGGKFGYRVWAGYLPPGGEKLVGIDAKLKQSLFGTSLSYAFDLGKMQLHLPLGFQQSSANIKGAITSKHAEDTFDTKTTAYYFSPGLKIAMEALGSGGAAWTNLLIGSKTTESSFEIPADGTTLEVEDSPAMLQWAVGVQTGMGIQAGAGVIYVPERLMMPRLLVGYQYAI